MERMISDYKKWILKFLLDKYEQSSAFKTGNFSRRIMLSISGEIRLQEVMEQVDEKHLLLATLEQLKNQGLIDYSWVKHEVGNLVDKVWLQPEAIEDCYQELGRTPVAELLNDFRKLASAYLEKLQPSSDFAGYIRDVIEYADIRKRIRLPFTADMELNKNLLECLVHLDEAPNQMERVFSSRYFGDSKYFERNLKAKVVSILRELQKQSIGAGAYSKEDLLTDEDLLIARGLYRWPEIFEFNGPLVLRMNGGSDIDTSTQVYGAYINSDTVKHLVSIDGPHIRRVIFIENKANYIDYQAHQKIDGDLIVYHGGFYSPIKGILFKKIYEGCPDASFYHWSDIDLGGFRIYTRLRNNIIPTVQPMLMDVETIKSNIDSCMEIKSEGYLQQLRALLDDAEYSVFSDVVKYMLENRVRLEQENLI